MSFCVAVASAERLTAVQAPIFQINELVSNYGLDSVLDAMDISVHHVVLSRSLTFFQEIDIAALTD